MVKKKQQGGLLRGPSHDDGGIAARVGGKELIELEGDEYVIKAPSARKLGKKTLDGINKTGRIPTMKIGGEVKKYEKGDKVTVADLPISEEKMERLIKGASKQTDRKRLMKELKEINPRMFAKINSEIEGESKSAEFKKKKTKKKQMGGRVQPSIQPNIQPNIQPSMQPNMPRQSKYQFRDQPLENMRYMKHGGEVSISNNEAGVGDIHTTHTKDGYTAGK